MKLQHKDYLKTFVIILAAVITIIMVVHTGFCAESLPNNVQDIAVQATQTTEQSKNDAIAKFIIAMAGVILSSVIIFLGLTIYNKFFVDKNIFKDNEGDDVLNTPKTVDEAVTMYIKRNKLC